MSRSSPPNSAPVSSAAEARTDTDNNNGVGVRPRFLRRVSAAPDLDLRPMVFHVRPDEAAILERALRRFGGPRKRRGAALAAAVRASRKGAKRK